ncbi:MAG: halocarboxylic acid dehydrogenase DehI family protein [Nitrospinota bacterium]
MTGLLLDEISERASSGRVADIYEDIKQTLRTTQVNLIYRTLSVHEAYFAAAWEALRPNASITYFERCADSLRMRMTPPMPEDVPDFEEVLEEECGYSEEQIVGIDQILDAYNYINPKNLILVDALRGALGGLKIGGVKPGFDEDLDPLPRAPYPAMAVPELIQPEEASGEIAEIFERIQSESGVRGVPSVWRALARYPEFVSRAWAFVREEQKKKGFEITVSLSQGAAGAAAQEFPHPVELSRDQVGELGCSDEEIDLIEKKLDHFIHLIPQTNVSILLMKAAVAGEGKVRRKPFE